MEHNGGFVYTSNIMCHVWYSVEVRPSCGASRSPATRDVTRSQAHRDHGDASKLFVNYPGLTKSVVVGSPILVDDGLVSLRVTDVRENSVTCLVENGYEKQARKDTSRE